MILAEVRIPAFVLAALFLALPARAQTAPAVVPPPVAAPALAAPPRVAAPAAPAPVVAPPPVASAPVVAPTAALPAPGAEPAAAPPPKPKPKRIVKAVPHEFVLPTDPVPTFQQGTYFATAKAAEQYKAIVEGGGWPILPAGTTIGPKSDNSRVAILRLRLSMEGDLQGGVTDTKWDSGLTAAVKHYQSRMGLRSTGIVTGATLKALNVPAATRYQQLSASAQRLSAIDFPFDDRYVVVNIPSASVEAVANGVVVKRYVAVVGDPGHPSPEVQAKVQAVNLNPTWTVPSSIIKNEIMPKMQRDPTYLSRERIRILDWKGKPIDPSTVDWTSDKAPNFMLRQDSGAGNSLGAIRINMPNKFSVYMHDTPAKRLFGADYRFLSHGCVRVSGVYELAQWLLDGTSGPDGPWTVAAMKTQIATQKRTDIPLTKPVPVIWVNLTGWSNADGIVHFRDDVYGIDVTTPDPTTDDLTAQAQLQ